MLLSAAQMCFKTINISVPQSVLILFSGSNTPNSSRWCAMLVMICPLYLSPGSSPTVHLSCFLTPGHHTPRQPVHNLWAHHAVSCFYPLSKTFLYLKYTLPLNQHEKFLLIHQEPPVLSRPLFCPRKADYPQWNCHHTLSSLVILFGGHMFTHLSHLSSYELLEDNSGFHFSLYLHAWYIIDVFIKWMNKLTHQSSEAAETPNCVRIFLTTL